MCILAKFLVLFHNDVRPSLALRHRDWCYLSTQSAILRSPLRILIRPTVGGVHIFFNHSLYLRHALILSSPHSLTHSLSLTLSLTHSFTSPSLLHKFTHTHHSLIFPPSLLPSLSPSLLPSLPPSLPPSHTHSLNQLVIVTHLLAYSSCSSRLMEYFSAVSSPHTPMWNWRRWEGGRGGEGGGGGGSERMDVIYNTRKRDGERGSTWLYTSQSPSLIIPSSAI